MSNLKHFLRDVGYFGVGAAAVIVEAGGKAVKALVTKGEKTLQDNQEAVDEFKRKARDLSERMKAAAEKSVAKAAPVDAAAMTPEERAELRRQLDEADQAAEPAEPEVIYPEEPVPEEVTVPEVAPVPTEPPILEVPEEDDPRDPFTRY